MIALLQRVSEAAVHVNGNLVGEIGRGMLALIGVERGDSQQQADRLLARLLAYRIFPDQEGRMNLDLRQAGGELLLVSQFTLAGSIRKGRRPGFDRAMPGDEAEPMFDRFVGLLRAEGVTVETGVFGAMMDVDLVNDGPVTLLWEDPP